MYPSDVVLPVNAKYYGFINGNLPCNTHWDITWSFSFALTGSEHGFVTFLTTGITLSSGIPGTRLGYLGNLDYLKDEDGNILLSDTGTRLTYDPYVLSGNETVGVLGIAFDTTGYFALSSETYDGVGIDQVKPNSLIIRDSNDSLALNIELSALDTTFFLTSAIKNYQTLRFRISKAGKSLYIDKQSLDLTYTTLIRVSLSSFDAISNTTVYSGVTFCSPISSSAITPSTLYLKNFHTQGSNEDATTETINYISILPNNADTTFSTLSNIL